MLEKYKIGLPCKEMQGKQEGAYFVVSPQGLMLFYNFYNPTPEEIEQVKSGKQFEICFMETKDIVFILTKAGQLSWVDAPYSPHLDRNFYLDEPSPGSGYSLYLFLVDAKDSTIKNMRLIGLGHNFSVELRKCIIENFEKPFDLQTYTQKIASIYNQYPTRELVKRSVHKFKLK